MTQRSHSEIQPAGRGDEHLSLPPAPANGPGPTGFYVEKVTSGPLPAPETLAEYNEVLPGLAERIVAAFEEEGRHRRECDRFDQAQLEKQVDAQVRQIDARIFDDRLKIFLSAIFIMSVIGVAALMAWMDHPNYAVLLIGGGGSVAGLASGARWLIRREPKQSQSKASE